MLTTIIGTDLDHAATLLRKGALVGLPTETVYGLAGNALNPLAVASIFRVKERPSFDPLIMHLPSLDRVGEYVSHIPEAAIQLAEAYWPGPLTMIFPRKAIVPDLVTSGLDTVAIRVPAHPLANALLRQLDFPLAAPSANPFGYISPTRAAHVQKQLGDKIQYILDGGPCTVGLESSIISFAGAEPVLLRKGGLALEDIQAVLGKAFKINTHSSSNPQAPGMLAKHYSPKTRLYLLDRLPADGRSPFENVPDELLNELLTGTSNGRRALITFGGLVKAGKSEADVFDLSPSGDLREAASQLFAIMRQLDEADYGMILAHRLPNYGLGLAINDRLERAAVQ